MKEFLRRHGQVLLNVYVAANVGGWAAWQSYTTWRDGRMNYVEAAFLVQNVVFVAVVLLRRPHRDVSRNILAQVVALTAFFSGLLFMGQEPTGGEAAAAVSTGLVLLANVLGIACMLNLGRNFGILIARRDITTRGLYGVVRHPMYGTDILLRIGFLVSHFHAFTLIVFIVSSACYVWRAVLEEKFLSRTQEYRDYMSRVRCRFIPGVF